MASKSSKQEWDLKETKKLFQNYLKRGQDEIKKKVKLPEDTVKIDDLSRKNILERIYQLIDSIIE
ncbi:MAG: hypothetical protein ACFFKA_21440, partial [Candidatus Thorarchaeota archaeon]